MRILAAAVSAGVLSIVSAAAASLPNKNVPMRTLKDASPLPAWKVFCDGVGKIECAVDPAQPERVALTDSIWKTISATNVRVNRTVKRVTDQEHWGAPDVWTLADDGRGDNEEYALLKRKLLVGEGLPRRAMRITVVVDEKGEHVAVLTLITDRGDYILDDRTNTVLAWHKTGYVFIKREAQDKIGWVSLGGVTDPSSYDKMSGPKDNGLSAPKP